MITFSVGIDIYYLTHLNYFSPSSPLAPLLWSALDSYI